MFIFSLIIISYLIEISISLSKNDNILQYIPAVSYTHLDVYKRQDQL